MRGERKMQEEENIRVTSGGRKPMTEKRTGSGIGIEAGGEIDPDLGLESPENVINTDAIETESGTTAIGVDIIVEIERGHQRGDQSMGNVRDARTGTGAEIGLLVI